MPSAPPAPELFSWATAAAWLIVVLAAATLRSRGYAIARGVLLAIHGLVAVALYPRTGHAWPLFVYLHSCVFAQSLMLVRPRMRPLGYRLLVSFPDAFFQAGTFLAFPFAIAMAFGAEPPGWWIGYALAALGLIQSFQSDKRSVDIVVVDGERVDALRRHRSGGHRSERPLRIVQITDPHLGAFMSVARLRAICERAVARDPDLVLLTGDFLTMESQRDPAWLTDALAPLAALDGRVFACMGNHDLEAPDTVRQAMASIGAALLIDAATTIDTPAGKVQIVGADFVWRGRAEHLAALCAAHPRVEGALRIVLLHDPGAFRHLPEGEGDLVLSGHTHGGQLGLVSFGLAPTIVSLLSSSPDHGLWARGTDRLYVHRGTGHYGFPVRLGVPAEESLLCVHARGRLSPP
jgi:hypothetical protein